ncbi:hypothetical protein [Actinocorallia longicatena]|uniref:Secreted protein n=1 Tax=Actinocorallia longicatena TaxID=111803 RepID=A0ABP6QFY9_9ACTN
MKTLTAVLAATAALTALAGAPAQAGGAHGSAFGVAAKGVVAIAPTPYVKSSTAETVTKALVKLPPNALLSASVNEVAASRHHAKAALADVVVGRLGLRATAVTASCDNGTGGAALADVALGAAEIPLYPKPNSGIVVPLGALGKAEVVLNRQVRLPGGGISVTAIQVSVVLAGTITQTIDIASVTCAGAPRLARPPKAVVGDLVVAG